jgi:hypothetical protein
VVSLRGTMKNDYRIMMGSLSSWKEAKSNTSSDLGDMKVRHIKFVVLKDRDDSEAFNPRTRSN